MESQGDTSLPHCPRTPREHAQHLALACGKPRVSCQAISRSERAKRALSQTKNAGPSACEGISPLYMIFVDSNLSSTHSFSLITGVRSTRPSKSAGTR